MINVRRVTEETEAWALHGMAAAQNPADMQMCAGAPPYPSLDTLQQHLRVGWPCYLADEDGFPVAFMLAKPDGETLWLTFVIPPRVAERDASGYAPSTRAIVVELMKAQGRDIGVLAAANTATRPGALSVMHAARLDAFSALSAEGVPITVNQ